MLKYRKRLSDIYLNERRAPGPLVSPGLCPLILKASLSRTVPDSLQLKLRDSLSVWDKRTYWRNNLGTEPLASRASDKGFLPMKLADYLKLVDWTGRQIANGKRDRILAKCKPILERNGLSREVWCDLAEHFGRVVGRPDSLNGRRSPRVRGIVSWTAPH